MRKRLYGLPACGAAEQTQFSRTSRVSRNRHFVRQPKYHHFKSSAMRKANRWPILRQNQHTGRQFVTICIAERLAEADAKSHQMFPDNS
jgi:hypothetical protein